MYGSFISQKNWRVPCVKNICEFYFHLKLYAFQGIILRYWEGNLNLFWICSFRVFIMDRMSRDLYFIFSGLNIVQAECYREELYPPTENVYAVFYLIFNITVCKHTSQFSPSPKFLQRILGSLCSSWSSWWYRLCLCPFCLHFCLLNNRKYLVSS